LLTFFSTITNVKPPSLFLAFSL